MASYIKKLPSLYLLETLSLPQILSHNSYLSKLFKKTLSALQIPACRQGGSFPNNLENVSVDYPVDEAIEGGIVDLSLVVPRLKELKSQKDSLQEEISYYESLNSQNQPVYITRSMIDKFRKEMEQIFMGNNVQEKRDFLKKFIEKIIVKDEGIEIVYYAPGVKFPSSVLLGA